MGCIFSTIALTLFEIANEIYLSIGGGILGVIVLTRSGMKCNTVGTILLSAITIGSLVYVLQSTDSAKPSPELVLFITGCDSGLGFSMAHHACEMGFTVLAGCLKLNSEGPTQLKILFGDAVQPIEIDITQNTSVQAAVKVIQDFLALNPTYKLWAVVNNAGVMVFGEFEWLTERLIQNQVDVNLMGSFRVTKAMCPLLRFYNGRIINISSHCALATLPGLAVYGATKSALTAWSDGIRVELNKYGVDVVTFIPGSFIQNSNIMANQVENSYEMLNTFTEEQKQFYGDYFQRYNSYLSAICAPKVTQKIDDPPMYTKFEKTLLDIPPKAVYIHEPFRYSIYHTLFKYSPVRIRDYLVTTFMQMPDYPVTS